MSNLDSSIGHWTNVPTQVNQQPDFSSGCADPSNGLPDPMTRYFLSGRHLAYVDAGTLSYTTGILGAALFMATSIGPGWLGFLVSYLPISVFTTWVASANE